MSEPTDTIRESVASGHDDDPAAPELIEDELLVEEISIDGMCGVY